MCVLVPLLWFLPMHVAYLLWETTIYKNMVWLKCYIHSYLKEEKLLFFGNGLEQLLVNAFVENDNVAG